jgi:hypothetical protein
VEAQKGTVGPEFLLGGDKGQEKILLPDICNASRAADCGEANRLITNSLKHTLGCPPG